MADDDFDLVFDNEAEEELRRRLEVFSELKERCAKAGIATSDTESLADDGPGLIVHMPCGRKLREVQLSISEQGEALRDIEFENYRFVPGYDAVFSQKSGTVIAQLRELGSSNQNGVSLVLRARLFRRESTAKGRSRSVPITLSAGEGVHETTISLVPISNVLSALLVRPSRLALVIERQALEGAEEVEKTLVKMANALFFQIEYSNNVALGLVRERQAVAKSSPKSKWELHGNVQFPTMEYDEAPISLYWYGRNASGMPLLQFLAYYQVLEYFYPVYSKAAANRRVQQVLKDPGFRADRDADVNRLLNVIQAARGGAIFDERGQLKATLTECLDNEELREYICEDENRKAWFLKKEKDGDLKIRPLPMNDPKAELVSEVAERIYQIRCKIVHTKADGAGGEVELLLPDSKEAAALAHDIELVRYVCQKVLISASVQFRL